MDHLRGGQRLIYSVGTYKIGRASSAATVVGCGAYGCSCKACFAN